MTYTLIIYRASCGDEPLWVLLNLLRDADTETALADYLVVSSKKDSLRSSHVPCHRVD